MSKKHSSLPEQRQQRIAMLVRESGSASVSGLEKELGISAATARRDLAVLERQGKVKRTHGGAVPPGLTQHEDSFQQRLGEAVDQKKRLARAAAALLGADETVFIDSSTTAYYAARRMLAGRSGVTFLTNLVPVMDLFSTADPSGVSMVGLGGRIRPGDHRGRAVYGTQAGRSARPGGAGGDGRRGDGRLPGQVPAKTRYAEGFYRDAVARFRALCAGRPHAPRCDQHDLLRGRRRGARARVLRRGDGLDPLHKAGLYAQQAGGPGRKEQP